jgi:hypothetical protein
MNDGDREITIDLCGFMSASRHCAARKGLAASASRLLGRVVALKP